MKLFCGGADSPQNRQGTLKPDVTAKNLAQLQQQPVPRKFREDIATLQELYGGNFTAGLCINWTLQQALEVLPRDRQRVDSYDSLAKYLRNERGVTLTIKSNKTR